MHGSGMHHHVHTKHEWKFVAYVKHLIALITGHSEREKLKAMFDKFIVVVGLVGPVMTIPQSLNIWMTHSVEGLVLASWATYVVTATFWLIYGILHREKAIIFANIAWILVNASIVVGVVIYS